MKFTHALCLLAVASVHAEDRAAAPVRTEEQFATLWLRSPFVLASTEPVSELAQTYAISGIATIGDASYVFIRDRKTQRRYSLTGSANEEGMLLVRIVPNDDPLKVRAVVRVKGREGTLSFDPRAVKPEPAKTAPTGPGLPSFQPSMNIPPVPTNVPVPPGYPQPEMVVPLPQGAGSTGGAGSTVIPPAANLPMIRRSDPIAPPTGTEQ